MIFVLIYKRNSTSILGGAFVVKFLLLQPQHAFRLLGILKRMPEKHGPDVYFDFSGKSGSVSIIKNISFH